MNIKKLSIPIYGTLCYLLFLATYLYTIGFVTGFLVPKHIDSPGQPASSTTEALLTDAGILGLFAIQHTIMARGRFKRRFAKLLPEAAERSTFVLVTCGILIALFLCWQPMPSVIWEVESPLLRNLIHGVSLLGFLGVVFATFLIDHFELFGLKQTLGNFAGKIYTSPSFQVQSLYRISRHPLYLFFFIAFWAAPTMTAGHLLFAVLTTGYVLIGIQFEERGLVAEHGEAYLSYRKQVPAIVPIPGRVSPVIRPQRGGGQSS